MVLLLSVGCSKVGGSAGLRLVIVVEADRRSTIVLFVAQAGLLWLELQPCSAWSKVPELGRGSIRYLV